MELWAVINDKGHPIAISENKVDIIEYFIIRRFPNTYFTTEITNKYMVEKLLIEYENLYLEHDLLMDFIGTRDEQKIIDSILREESSRLSNVIKDIEYIQTNYDLSEDKIEILNKTLHILKEVDKPKKFKKLFKLKDVFDMFIRKAVKSISKSNSDKPLFLFFKKN